MLCQLKNEEHLIKMYGFEVCSTLKRRTPLKNIWFWRDQSHCDRNGWFHWWLVHLVLGRGKLRQNSRNANASGLIYDAKCSLGSLPSSCALFLLQSYSKMMRMLSCLPSLLQCSFLITFLFKSAEKCSPGALPSSCAHFLLLSYSKMMRNALLAPFPPPVCISYYILI